LPIVATRRIFVPESAHVARTLLGELRHAHCTLIEAIAEMDRLTREPAPDAPACATGRWRLGQASLERRLIVARICDYFIHRLDDGRRGALKELMVDDQALLRERSSLLARWPTNALEKDWAGFCEESRAFRGKKRAHIAMEQKLLYPMLQDAAKAAA